MNDVQLIDKFLEYMEFNKGRAKGTIANYRRYLVRLSEYLISEGATFLTAKPEQVSKFAGVVCHNAGHNASGRRLVVASIRSFYHWVEREYIGSNVAARLEYPKPIKHLPVPMQVSNAEKLLNSIVLDSFLNIRDAAIIALFLGTGLRLSGLRNLNKSNLEVSEIDGKERLFIRVIEKGKKERIVPVPDVMYLFISVYLNHEDYQSAQKTTESGEDVLFINTNNRSVEPCDNYGERRRLSTRAIAKMIHKRGAVLGIPERELKPHAIRHLYGTELAESGVDLHKIQLLLGHVDISTTVHYLHLARRKLHREVNEHSPLAGMNTVMHELQRTIEGKPIKRA